LQILDSRQILAVIDIMRAYDPNQADAIRKAAKEQLSKRVNVPAEEMIAEETPEMPELGSEIGNEEIE
jgi:ADP-dependent phosphofructokinase/glucokinase